MAPADRPRTLFTGQLNRRGTTEAQFRFPAGLAGTFPMRYVVDTPIGSTEYTQQVRLEEKAAIMLTTEKPIYQPGQSIHVRALALDRASHEATAGRKLTLEVEDSRGNKVFKKITQTDKYGVASAEFGLADEVNLGTYHLRALMDSGAGRPANAAGDPDLAEGELHRPAVGRGRLRADAGGATADHRLAGRSLRSPPPVLRRPGDLQSQLAAVRAGLGPAVAQPGARGAGHRRCGDVLHIARAAGNRISGPRAWDGVRRVGCDHRTRGGDRTRGRRGADDRAV